MLRRRPTTTLLRLLGSGARSWRHIWIPKASEVPAAIHVVVASSTIRAGLDDSMIIADGLRVDGVPIRRRPSLLFGRGHGSLMRQAKISKGPGRPHWCLILYGERVKRLCCWWSPFRGAVLLISHDNGILAFLLGERKVVEEIPLSDVMPGKSKQVHLPRPILVDGFGGPGFGLGFDKVDKSLQLATHEMRSVG